MASIHTHPRSLFWMAHYFHDGKRTTKSTRVLANEEGREQAQQRADAWETAASMAGEGRDGREWMAATLNVIFGAVGLPVLKKEAETWESASARWLEVCRGRRANAPSTLSLLSQARQEITDGRPGASDRLTFIHLGLCTGARLMDCARMKWENINLKAALISYVPQKKARDQ